MEPFLSSFCCPSQLHEIFFCEDFFSTAFSNNLQNRFFFLGRDVFEISISIFFRLQQHRLPKSSRVHLEESAFGFQRVLAPSFSFFIEIIETWTTLGWFNVEEYQPFNASVVGSRPGRRRLDKNSCYFSSIVSRHETPRKRPRFPPI